MLNSLRVAVFLGLAATGAVHAEDVLMQRYNIERTGSVVQPGLSQATLRDPRWGEVGRLAVDGVVYAQPLYVEALQGAGSPQPRSVVFVATGHNALAAFDAKTLQPIWGHGTLLAPNDRTAVGKPGCDGISLPGGIGIEATPVIDRARNVMYVSYRTNPSATDAKQAQQRLRAIDIRDGHQIADVQILPPGAAADWTVWHRSRAGLLLDRGVVYVGFASRCEDPGTPMFNGWVLGYDAASLRRVAAYSPTASGTPGQTVDGGGIWQGAQGLAADGEGNIYATTGNRRAGVDHAPADMPNQADSLVKLTPTITRAADGTVASVDLRLADYFTPYRKIWLDDQDLDLAAAGPVLVPATDFVLAGGKSGIVYVLNRGALGKLDQAHAWTADTLAKLPLDTVQAEQAEDFAADHVAQKFQAAFNQYVPPGSPYLPRAGAPVTAAMQNAGQTDAFAVGRDGAVHVWWQGGEGAWTDGASGRPGPAAITPPGFAPVNAHLATAKQAGTQLDTFVVGHDGAIHVVWEVGDGHWTDGTPGQPGPARITPPGFAPSGAPLATAWQGAGQLDAFVVGLDGGVHVTWAGSSGVWADGLPGHAAPALITPPHLAPPGAGVAAAAQGAGQLDAFVVGNDGAAYVTWVAGGGIWTDGGAGHGSPARITPPNFAPPGAAVAAAAQGASQLDVFVVGRNGAAAVTWAGGGGHWADGTPGNPGPAPITPPGFVPPGGCLTAAAQNDGQLDVFMVGHDGAVYVTWAVGGGHWADGSPGNPAPARISPPGTAMPGGCVAAVRSSKQQMDALATGPDGSVWLTWEVNDGRWRDGGPGFEAQRLTQAVWMRGCWPCWPHIHGSPVFAAFPQNHDRIYVWPEKDHLKSYAWLGDHVDAAHPVLATGQDGAPVLAPPGPPFGMPGGMLAVSIDPAGPDRGVLFASIPRPEGVQMNGMLRAFDPMTLRELWNNGGTGYMFAKFVPPTVAGGRVFLPTGSGTVIVYGLR